MFTAEYWWVALIQLCLFALFNVFIFLLRNRPQKAEFFASVIALFLLIYKISEYIYWQCVGEHIKIPVEFSALSYFIFAITVFFRIKRAQPFAVFVSLLTGIMYTVSMLTAPDAIVNSRDSIFLLATAMLNHELLYLGGMLMFVCVSRKYDIRDSWFFAIGVGIMVGYAWIVHLFTDYSLHYGTPIIIKICDGSIMKSVFTNIPVLVERLLVIVFVLLLVGAIIGFYALNRFICKQKLRRKELILQPADEDALA